jgi:hypothetical protein
MCAEDAYSIWLYAANAYTGTSNSRNSGEHHSDDTSQPVQEDLGGACASTFEARFISGYRALHQG